MSSGMVASKLLVLAHNFLGLISGLLVSIGVLGIIDFKGTITLGSVMLGFIFLIAAGIFTVRSKIASIWREDAEGQKAAKELLQETLNAERAARAIFEREQQELRHDLKAEIAAYRAQLKAMEAKTDLTAALEAIREIGDHGTTVSIELAAMIGSWNDSSVKRDEETHKLLTEIRDKLPSEPITVREITQE